VTLFLDSSVLIAAAASAEGASREVFHRASTRDWRLITTPYAVAEVIRNLAGFAAPVPATWVSAGRRLKKRLTFQSAGGRRRSHRLAVE
jgi:predicted nucleic acid-binding protein